MSKEKENFKTIKTTYSKEELDSVGDLDFEIIEEDAEDDEPEEVDLDKESEDDNEVEDESEDKSEEEEVKPKRRQRKEVDKPESRAQKRIRQLVEERKAEEERARKLEEELNTYRSQTKKSEASRLKDMEIMLENQLKSLNSRYANALENDEASAAGEINSSIMDVKLKLAGIKHELLDYSEEDSESTSKGDVAKTPPKNTMPQEALNWMEDFPEFRKDKVFTTAAVAINAELINEGWDIESSEFYDELTERLEKTGRFNDIFGVDTKNSVQLDNNSSNDVKEKSTKPKSRRYTEQTVSENSSYESAKASTKSKKNKNRVILTAEDQKAARTFGMTMEQYAKHKKALEDRKSEETGYTEILIK